MTVTDADRDRARAIVVEWENGGHDGVLEAAIAAALAEAREEGRDSVGLADFMPNPCEDETEAPNEHFFDSYGRWLDCTLAKGHDGKHEHETSGLRWSAS